MTIKIDNDSMRRWAVGHHHNLPLAANEDSAGAITGSDRICWQAPLSQIARDFGIPESCLHRWVKLAGIEDGTRPGARHGGAGRVAGAARP
jgi:hypothetical protein